MSDPITNILYAVGGFIFGGFVTYEYRIWWYKRTKYIDACIEFRDAFSDFIHWLNHEAIKSSESVFGKLHMTEISKRQEEAIKKFRSHLKPTKQLEFDGACIKFYSEKNNHRYEGYANLDRIESRKLALENINELLRFAKY